MRKKTQKNLDGHNLTTHVCMRLQQVNRHYYNL